MNRLHLRTYICIHIHVHAVTISEKEAMNLEENLRHGSAWSEEREGRNVSVYMFEGQTWARSLPT